MKPVALAAVALVLGWILFGPALIEAATPEPKRGVTVTYIARDAAAAQCPDVSAQPSGSPLVPLR